jgi:serine/threonine protein kinase/Tol biopolymer transport system component
MTTERWQEIERLYHEAQKHGAGDRRIFLDCSCAGDEPLRREVESLLECRNEAQQHIQTPAGGLAANALAHARIPSPDLTGQTILHFRIDEKIGSGGMGEVYRAHDTLLERDVAIKVLPDIFSGDPERMARFEREARILAALNHPHVAVVHSIERIDTRRFLVLELMEGETLDRRIARGRLPVSEAVEICHQIAEGLDAAHSKGVIHRDIKPPNIFVADGGHAKILDFGLAKLMQGHGANPTAPPDELRTSPGMTFGTVSYMSPEQALGRELDGRADLFSLGIVLYEMVAGVQPFRGESLAAVFDAILNKTPTPPVRLNPDLPASLERIIEKLLEKDREMRYQSAKEILADLKRLVWERNSAKMKQQISRSRVNSRGFKIFAAGILILLIAISSLLWKIMRSDQGRIPSAPVIHRQISFVGDALEPAISPDGQFVAYVTGEPETEQRLMLQDLSGGQAIELWRGKNVRYPRWSPDGSELLAFSEGMVLIPRLGQARRVVGGGVHSCWSPDGSRMAMAPLGGKGFRIVDKATGETTKIPLSGFQFLSDLDWSARSNLLLLLTDSDNRMMTIWTVRPDGTRQRRVIEAGYLSSPRWSHDGNSIYFLRKRGTVGELAKIPVDPESGEVAGPASLVLGGLPFGGYITLSADASRLAYTRELHYSNLWLARTSETAKGGIEQPRPITTGTALIVQFSISPDGKWIAFTAGSPYLNIHKMPIEGGKSLQLTFSEAFHLSPAWSPDGKQIAFCSNEGGACKVWIVSSAGGLPKKFSKSQPANGGPVYWSPGTQILYQTFGNRNFLFLNSVTEEENPLLQDVSLGWIFAPMMSPDGKKVAVDWNRRPQGIWVLTLADHSAKLLAEGYLTPIGWSPDGSTIYISNITAVRKRTIWALPANGGALQTLVTMPGPILEARSSPDGKLFVCSIDESKYDVWVAENFDPSLKK